MGDLQFLRLHDVYKIYLRPCKTGQLLVFEALAQIGLSSNDYWEARKRYENLPYKRQNAMVTKLIMAREEDLGGHFSQLDCDTTIEIFEPLRKGRS